MTHVLEPARAWSARWSAWRAARRADAPDRARRRAARRTRVLLPLARAYAAAATRVHSARFSLMQTAGGAAASVGVFQLWGFGVGLLVTGAAVLAAFTVLERGV